MADEQHKPMSNERLAEIYDFMTNREQDLLRQPVANTMYVDHVRQLLAEVERLRAREAAAMEIVRAVAESPDTVTLTYVPKPFDKFVVVPLPARDKARALLAQEDEVE